MKVVILTADAPIYIAPFLDDLLNRLRGRHEVLAVYAFGAFQRAGRRKQLRERLGLYGPTAMLRMMALIYRNKISGLFGARTTVRNVLARHGLACQTPANVNQPEFIESLKRSGAEVLLSVACPQILKTPILRALPLGCINYHTAALPKYRGRMPMFWALFHGEKQVGITVHAMDEKIDNGPILVQRLLPIDPGETLHSLYLKTTKAGPELVVEALDKLARGDTTRLPNDEAISTYFGFPSPEQAADFRRRGGRFF
jgi:methionyl-tRNA formyltransferase